MAGLLSLGGESEEHRMMKQIRSLEVKPKKAVKRLCNGSADIFPAVDIEIVDCMTAQL